MKEWKKILIPDKKDIIIGLFWSLSQPVVMLMAGILRLPRSTDRSLQVIWFPYEVSLRFVTEKLYPNVRGDALMMFGVHIILLGFILTVYIVHFVRLPWSFKEKKE